MEFVTRFLVGGTVVSIFALLGGVLKPKSFAGLFGAAPSVALATITLTVLKKGKPFAAIEAQSMIAGAIAFMLYAYIVCWMLMRKKSSVLITASFCLVVWLVCALGLWRLFGSGA